MLSQRCIERNKTLIPKLMKNHGAMLNGDLTMIDLSTAENRLLSPKLLGGLNDTLKHLPWSTKELGYSEGVGGCPRVRARFADLFNDTFNPRIKVDKGHIVLGAGGCFALKALIGELCNPGDGILIAAPYWPGLDLWIETNNGVTPVRLQIPFDEFFTIESIKYYEAALKAAKIPIKAVLICNPHNPLGQNYPRETLQAMLDFCANNSLHYISDEVYALSQHGTTINGIQGEFVSALALDASNAKGLVHVLYSLSKDFGCNGVRIGAFVTQENPEVFLSGALSTFCQTSTMATLISEKVILTEDYIDFINNEGRALLRKAYLKVEAFMKSNNVEYVEANSGMYIFARLCPETKDAEATFRDILKENALVISAGTDYHFATPGWFRICYACDEEKLTIGLERIAKCIEMFRQAS